MGLFTAPGVALLLIEPLTAPVAGLCFLHAWAVPMLQARRGARSLVPIGSERSAATDGRAEGPERVALGLLADLLGHAERDALRSSGLARWDGELGIWFVGEQGAMLVRRRGRLACALGGGWGRVHCWCVRVGDVDELPAADRVAHLLLALREDELGFATVANLGFSGAEWRVRRHLPHGAAAVR